MLQMEVFSLFPVVFWKVSSTDVTNTQKLWRGHLKFFENMQYCIRFCHWIHCKHSSNYFKASSFAWKKWLKVINVSSLRTFDDKFIGNVYVETAIISVSKNHCHEKSKKHYWAQKSFAFTPESENGIKRQVNINIMCSRWVSPHDHRRVRQDSEK